MTDHPLLSVENLSVHFPLRRGFFGGPAAAVKAVDDISFTIARGETFGLVGESGCGKTSTGKSILGVVAPTAGRVVYKGEDLATPGAYTRHRRAIQLIFQDPYGSLDPRQSAFAIIAEAVTAGGDAGGGAVLQARVAALLDAVELPLAMADRFPHEMSGGQRQRLGIARALACDPELIVCDEPVSALDVSIQAQIINLFKRIQRDLGIAYLFVAHDLAVVRHVSNRIGVMYLGRLIEVTDAAGLYLRPRHPYTQALLSAIPLTDYRAEQARQRVVLRGEVPSPIDRPTGCPFHPRCDRATPECRIEMPNLRVVESGHSVACHHA